MRMWRPDCNGDVIVLFVSAFLDLMNTHVTKMRVVTMVSRSLRFQLVKLGGISTLELLNGMFSDLIEVLMLEVKHSFQDILSFIFHE